MGVKGSVNMCLSMSGPVFTIRPVYLPAGEKAPPAPLATWIGSGHSCLGLPSAVELKGYMHSETASLWSPFCLGRPGVRYEGRGLRQTSVGRSVTSVQRFLAGPWHSGSEAHCFASA